MMQNTLTKVCLWIPLLAGLLLLDPGNFVQAQDTGEYPNHVLHTRSKMWIGTSAWGLEWPDSRVGSGNAYAAYPGYYGVANNFINDRTWVYYMGTRDPGGQNFSTMQRARWPGPTRVWGGVPGQQITLHQNYNFKNSTTMPEEWSSGWAQSNAFVDTDGNNHNLVIRVKCENFAWSLPKYDDFIIRHYVIYNWDTVDFTNFRYGWYGNLTPVEQGWGSPFVNDTEYWWLTDLPGNMDAYPYDDADDDFGLFAYYDDTQILQSAPDLGETEYSIEPGKSHGDVGDPGNIRQQGSINFALESPQVVAKAWVDGTPPAPGEKAQAWYNIKSSEWDPVDWPSKTLAVPTPEWYEYETSQTYGTYNEFYKYVDMNQTRADYRDAPNAIAPNDVNELTGLPYDHSYRGTYWERTPAQFMTVGPYDLSPGDSIEIWEFYIAGEMDRSISERGGTDAVEKIDVDYLEANGKTRDDHAGLVNFKKNWNAAWELYQGWLASGKTDWNAAIDSFPPPTPGNTPRVGLGNELGITKFSDAETEEAGFILDWDAVHEGYTDPRTGKADFAKYIIYRSEVSIDGPWEPVDSISVDEADQYIQSGRMFYKVVEEPGIPFRYAVTTKDWGGNESGRTAFTWYANVAPRAPSNQLSKVQVVPNPFRQQSGFLDASEQKRLEFINIPSQCTIRIYTVAGDLVQTVEHDGFGSSAWGSSTGNNYMLSRFGMNVMPGVYIWHLTSHVEGHKGEERIGKLVIIK